MDAFYKSNQSDTTPSSSSTYQDVEYTFDLDSVIESQWSFLNIFQNQRILECMGFNRVGNTINLGMSQNSGNSDHLIKGDSSVSPTIIKLNAANDQTTKYYFEKEPLHETKVYKYRWIVLVLFIFYSATSTFQWLEYSIITNIITRYYGVSSLAVDWTSMTYMLYYVILVTPGSYFSERIGLRWTTILGSVLCCIGSWIKVFSVRPDGFLMTFIGQSFIASTQVLVLTTPGRLAAQWFHSDQISTATSLGIFGNQLGIAICFFLIPVVVKNHVNLDDIGKDLYLLFLVVAIITSVATLLVLIFFRDEPRLSPSTTRALQRANHNENKEKLVEPVKRLLTNRSFLILCNSYGLNVGVLNAVGTLLNQIYLYHFENGEEDAGRLGLAIIVMGMIGSVTFGIILDKTKKFKGTTVTVYLLTLLGQIMFAIAMWCEVKWMVYVAATFLGVFMSGYLALGYEMCAEYTYPEAESIATGILNVANNIYGIIMVLISGILMEKYGDLGVHVCLCGALLIGLIMTIMTKDETRRQDAQRDSEYRTIKASDAMILNSELKTSDKQSDV